MAQAFVRELVKPPASPPFILGNLGKCKLTVGLGICDVGVDNDCPPTHLCHQVDKLARLIQVVKDATAENRIEVAILRQVLHVVTGETQVGQIGPRFDSLTILKVARPDLDAQRIETSTRQFDGIATLEAP